MLFFFFFNDTATTEIYTYVPTLSLHDALPIWWHLRPRPRRVCDDAHWHGDLRAAPRRRAGQVRAFRRRRLLDAGDRTARRDAGPVGAGVPVRRARPVPKPQLGRAAGRERVCQSGKNLGVAGNITKNKNNKT